MELEAKRVLLTGATGGLGRAIAEQLGASGATLVLSSRKKNDLEELAGSLPGGANRHVVMVADLAKRGAADNLIRDAGDIDALVANAALPATGKLESFSEEELARALLVNVESPMMMARALAPKLAKKGEGHLVFIASLAGKVGSPSSSVYNATKFGIRGFAFGLREDLHRHGVGVSLVSPGFVREAGLFADAGTKLPPGIGTTTPKKVGMAVVRAILGNRVEITVAPMPLRFLAEFGYRHPEFAARVQRRGGADRVADNLAAGQADKR